MERDTIKGYSGRMVKVDIDLGGNRRFVYFGKVSNYDQDFITLNPFMYNPRTPYEKEDIKEAFKTLGEFDAGTTNRQITLGRRTILSIEEILKPNE